MKKLSLLMVALTTLSFITVTTPMTDNDKKNVMLIGAASITLAIGGYYACNYYYSTSINQSTVTTSQQPSAEQQNTKPKSILALIADKPQNKPTLIDALSERNPAFKEFIKQQQTNNTQAAAPTVSMVTPTTQDNKQLGSTNTTNKTTTTTEILNIKVKPGFLDHLYNSVKEINLEELLSENMHILEG